LGKFTANALSNASKNTRNSCNAQSHQKQGRQSSGEKEAHASTEEKTNNIEGTKKGCTAIPGYSC